MPERTRDLLYGFAIVVMASIVVALVATSPSDADRVEQLGNSIKCPVCQGESIADSPSTMARDMMAVVEERVEQGWTDQQIIDELLASYSGAVLLDPPTSGATLLLWVSPFLALAIGACVIAWWRRHPTDPSLSPDPAPRSRKRMLVGGLLLAGAFAAIVVAAGFFLQDRQGPGSGVAELEGQDLSEVSNETMEAVVAANLDSPQIDGMRLALAERYYEAGDYRSAFPHYLAVAESPGASDAEAVTALIRLGWMAWDGNDAAEPALEMFDQALAIDSSSSTARYLKGRVLWCGIGDSASAAQMFQQVLDDGGLPEASMAQVQSDLESIRNGEACR